jgi:hypothetical protein
MFGGRGSDVAPVEFTREELVHALRSQGRQLVQAYFEPHENLEFLIRQSVGGNTFRSFQKMSRPPSEVFREWANARLSFAVMDDLGQISDQAGYDAFINGHADHLSRHWHVEGKRPLLFGPGRKLINLLFKFVVRSKEVPEVSRQRLIPLLHVPFDLYSLTALRQSAASGEFGEPIEIPANPSMGWISSADQYDRVLQVARGVTASAGVPAICMDLLAWDHAHTG